MYLETEEVWKIALALVAGGLIGLEREFRDKAAGFRTLIFICLGATLFTLLSIRLAAGSDPTRITANIVTGIGFLGAGVIMRDAGRIVGLTTASTIWLTAAIGMGIGGGQYALAAAVTGTMLVVLWLFPRLENWVDHIHEERTYEVAFRAGAAKATELEALARASGLRLGQQRHEKRAEHWLVTWHLSGPPARHERLLTQLLADSDVVEVHY